MTKDSPHTVAGAAAALGKFPRTAFPFDPRVREPSRISRSLPGKESMPSFGPAHGYIRPRHHQFLYGQGNRRCSLSSPWGLAGMTDQFFLGKKLQRAVAR